MEIFDAKSASGEGNVGLYASPKPFLLNRMFKPKVLLVDINFICTERSSDGLSQFGLSGMRTNHHWQASPELYHCATDADAVI